MLFLVDKRRYLVVLYSSKKQLDGIFWQNPGPNQAVKAFDVSPKRITDCFPSKSVIFQNYIDKE